MEQVKEINIKNQAYYFRDDMINIKNFHSNLLKVDKKSHENINIYYISHMMIKKFSDYENICSVNSFYLIIHSAIGHFKEKYGEKYSIIDLTEEYKKVLSGIKSEIRTLNGGKELFYEKYCARTGINTDDDLPLKKQLKFPKLAIIIRCVFQKGEKLDPQVYLDECMYELV